MITENLNTENVTAEQVSPPATLTITDLVTVANIINHATKAGAFNAAEASEVGAAYTNLMSFIQQTVKQYKEQNGSK